jgi:hypothetical protein
MDTSRGSGEQQQKGRPRRFSHRGCEVDYDDPGGTEAPAMTIDRLDVMIRREEAGGFSAPMLNIHATFSPPLRLGQGGYACGESRAVLAAWGFPGRALRRCVSRCKPACG